ncbi:RNA polymerase sigma factor [Paenibacillus eucommiae]|uniref:RNA polymerase sigma-70 factor (ECF subfamily) n=1 Tax=Paenibacillus eucommiae TaxID=1355755 RepID=A0ABS4JA19_9BACL|nr:sigma-70 family RNA polymerase sigma factor [Paenibacillus eucommiae]MBP1996100.1 RNA polymerase sigma-70 factor (ECF subfamily) [Paenibacillus eucommiae]
MEQAVVKLTKLTKLDELDELYAEHSVYLNKFMLKLTRNREEAADLVQEIFLRLCEQESLPEHPKSWLSQTGYRLFIDQWRRKQRISWLPLDHYAVSSQTTPEQVVLDMEFKRFVRRLLLQLKPRMHAALYLRIYKQSSYREIARQLDCSENTVKSFVRRGKAQLSKLL